MRLSLFVFSVSLLVLVTGCDDRRIVTPQETAVRFEEALGDNHVLPGDAGRRVVVRRDDPITERLVPPPAISRTPSAYVGIDVHREPPITDRVVEPTTVVTAENIRPADPFTDDYVRQSVITVHGAVTGFQRMPLSHDRTGLFVRLHVGGDAPLVYLGPQEWLYEHQFVPEITNMMRATGSRITTTDGRTVIIAREAALRKLKINIRDEDGVPLYPVPAGVDAPKKIIIEKEPGKDVIIPGNPDVIVTEKD